jgi:hypothetical protein
MARGSFVWRGESYRIDSGTWLFWGHARLIQLPGNDAEFRMTPDDALFIDFAVQAGCSHQPDAQAPETLIDCQAFLEQGGHQVWRVQQALQIVRDEADTDLATRLLGCLIDWFFISKV